jgi:acetyltransferase-like isoleucine patch superfamily enzyme
MSLGDYYRHNNLQAGPGCDISPFCRLDNVVLGSQVTIRDEVQLRNVVIGDNCRISRRVTLYSPDPNRPIRVGHYCWFSYDVFGEATGDDIAFGDYVVIAHSSKVLTSSGPGNQSPIMSKLYPTETGSVVVGAHSWIGAHCVLLPGSVFEQGVVLGAGSVSRRGQYTAWSVYGGNPAKFIKPLMLDGGSSL